LVVAINSDDAEMARRLNQEAGKTVKYGGLSEQEAWKMVTLNPAKLLHLDNRMGSIVTGKDADLVMWSDNPLSINAKAEKTVVDGILFFDSSNSTLLEQQNVTERQRIIQKMLKSKKDGQPAVPPQPKVQHLWHCDDLGEE
jgi:adenine deaminase